jgi:P-type conjugative transfer protein TrbJ
MGNVLAGKLLPDRKEEGSGMNVIKKLFALSFSSFLFISFLTFLPVTSQAMIVFDPAVFGKLIQELAQSEQQLMVLKQQLDALKQLNPSQYQWSNAQGVINNLGNVISQANGIAYSGQNLQAQFQKNFPGYQAPDNYSQQYQQIVSTTLNTLNGVLQSVGSSAQDFQNENSRLAFLQQQAQSAIGQTQAIQASAQIASEQVSQLQLLRQTLMAQINAQTTYYAGQVQKEASANAELDQLIGDGNKKSVPFGSDK